MEARILPNGNFIQKKSTPSFYRGCAFCAFLVASGLWLVARESSEELGMRNGGAMHNSYSIAEFYNGRQFAVSGWQETRNRNLTFYKEVLSLEQPPLPTASPPKGGDETLVRKWIASWFPLWGERWCEAPKGAC